MHSDINKSSVLRGIEEVINEIEEGKACLKCSDFDDIDIKESKHSSMKKKYLKEQGKGSSKQSSPSR